MAEEIIKDSAPFEVIKDDSPFETVKDSDPFAAPAKGATATPAKPKTEGWADWAKRKYTEYIEPTEKLQQAAAGRVMGLGAGAGQAATSAGSAVADYAGAPGMAKYLSDMEQKFTKGAETAKEISYPKGLTKEEAERGQLIGDAGAMVLLAEAAPGTIGSYAMRIPGVGPAVEATEGYLAPRIAQAGEYLAPKMSAAKDWLTKPFRGAATEAAAGEAATAGEGATGAMYKRTATEAAEKAAAEKAKEMTKLQAGLEILKGSTKAAPKGAALFGSMATIDPRTEATQEERASARWEEMRSSALVGGVLGGAMGALGPAAYIFKKTWGELSPAEKQKAVEVIEQQIVAEGKNLSGGAKQVVENRQGVIEKAGERKSSAEAALTPLEQKIDELAQASTEATRRERYEATDAQARKIAGNTNLTRKQADAFVAESQKIFEEAEQQAEKQRSAQYAAVDPVTGVEAGKALGEPLVKREEALKTLLEDNSGWSDLTKELGTTPKFPVADVIAQIDRLFAPGESAAGPAFEKFAKGIKKELEEAAEAAGADGKVSGKIVDDIRKRVQSAISKGIADLGGAERTTAGANLEKLEPIEKALKQSLIDGDKRFESVIKNYAELSESLEPFRKEAGAFNKLTEKFFGKNLQTSPRDVLDQVIKRTEKGEEGLKELVDDNPSLKNVFRRYFQGELFGASEESARAVTAKALDEFRKSKAETLLRTGLTKEFEELSAARRAAEQNIVKAQKGLTEAEKLRTSTSERLTEEEALRKFESGKAEKEAAPHRKTAKEAADEMTRAASEQAQVNDKMAELNATLNADKIVPEKVLSESKSIAEMLYSHTKDYLPATEREAVLTKLNNLEAELKRTNDQLKFARDVRATISTFAARAAAAATGSSVPVGYGLWRFMRGAP